MSAASLDDFGTLGLNKESHNINDERTRILNMVSRKAKDQTLTLEETTALYEKFNQTYSAYRSTEPQEVDESWAIELLQECEQDESIRVQEPTLLQTRVNGIPHQTKKNATKPTPKAQASANDDSLISVTQEKSLEDIRNLHFNVSEHFVTGKTNQRHDAFATFIIASSVITVASLLAFSIFF
jgi:hypothetical protein